MKSTQLQWTSENGWQHTTPALKEQADIVFFFGGSAVLTGETYEYLRNNFQEASIIGCSTAGEILEDEVLDNSIVATAIRFENTPVQVASIRIGQAEDSEMAGRKIAKELIREDLRAVFVISDGHIVNGSQLVKGLQCSLPEDVIISGGLAGDGEQFNTTLVSCNNSPRGGQIAAVGFYGDSIRIGNGSVGGWDPFGPKRIITRAHSNVLYELDHKPALELYKKYLGDDANRLPASALLFPLMIRIEGEEDIGTVRTILNVDEEQQSMTFAGDIPEGQIAQLMMANFDRLVDGAAQAAKYASLEDIRTVQGEKLALLISCVGRKMVLGQRVTDEIEAVREILGEGIRQIGFYSYGEIAPHNELLNCQLHNQTMTITLLAEDAQTA